MKNLLGFTAILGGIGVILGALGAHALKNQLTPEQLKSFQTGVLYHLLHVLAAFIVASLPFINSIQKINIIVLFWVGILFFSGSIYLIYLAKVPAKSIWFITPLGGIIFMFAWFLLSYYFFKSKA